MNTSVYDNFCVLPRLCRQLWNLSGYEHVTLVFRRVRNQSGHEHVSVEQLILCAIHCYAARYGTCQDMNTSVFRLVLNLSGYEHVSIPSSLEPVRV